MPSLAMEHHEFARIAELRGQDRVIGPRDLPRGAARREIEVGKALGERMNGGEIGDLRRADDLRGHRWAPSSISNSLLRIGSASSPIRTAALTR